MSAETSVRRSRPGALGAIENDAVPSGRIAEVVIRSILASGGASRASESRNVSTAAGVPSTSANTPSTSLPTSPPSPRPVASEYTNGRKPTP